MLVGQGRAGKTALANNMMGKGYQGKTDSTIGAEKFDRRIVCGKIDKNQSLLKEYSSPVKELEHLLMTSMISMKRSYQSEAAADLLDVEVVIDTVGDLDRTSLKINDEKTGTSRFTENLTSEDDFQHSPEKAIAKRLTLDDIDSSMIKQYSENISEDSELIVSLYDFGGQDIFNVLHPFFMSKYGVYVVVFDMELFVSKDEEKRESCMKHLKFWMNSIVMHTYDEKSGKTAPVAIVGTRKDKISRLKDHEKISILLSEMFSSSPVWSSLLRCTDGSGSLHFFPVNNTKWFFTSAAVKLLLDSCVNILKDADFVKKPVSLVWIKILDEIKAKKTSFLGILEVQEICAVYSLSSDEIAEMLTFFYEMGILIWINEEKLRDIVILDPIEYFVKPATMIICKHIATKDDPYHTVHCEEIHRACRKEWPEDWFQMLEFGLVSERLATRLLESVCKTEDHVNKVLVLMERFGFLTRTSGTSIYLFPSLLPENPGLLLYEKDDLKLKNLISRLNSRRTLFDRFQCRVSFYFVFYLPATTSIMCEENAAFLSADDIKQTGFLPNGLFTRFITVFINESGLAADFKSDSIVMFRDEIHLCYQNRNIKLCHLMKQNMIQVEIEEDNSSHPLKPDELLTLHHNLSSILSSSIQQCFENLQFITVLPVSSELLSNSSSSSGCCQGFLSLSLIQGFPPSSPRKHCISLDGLLNVYINHDMIQKEYPLWITISQDSQGGEATDSASAPPVVYTDVFLSHDWGKDNINHEKVKIINQVLQKKGLITWFDEERIEGDIIDRMTEGIEKTKCVLVFVTENYRNKVNGSEKRDNCYREFSHAVVHKGPQKLISIVMEKDMRNTREWKGQLGVALQNDLFYDFSEIDFSRDSTSSFNFDEQNVEFKMKIEKLYESINKKIKNQ
jgi:GTPase SAR1 family protein